MQRERNGRLSIFFISFVFLSPLVFFSNARNNERDGTRDMVQNLIAEVCAELDLPIPQIDKTKAFPFFLREDVEVTMRDLEPGVSFHAKICSTPLKRKEDLFLLLMRANYLGQSTGITRIGMSDDEKFLTLSSSMPYELTYRTFRESLEDFVNFLLYWREEIATFETQDSIV